MKSVARHCLVVVLVAAWIGAVVYPDPRPFFNSVTRLRNPPIDAVAAAEVAATLPDDYRAIEEYVAEYVPWESAWILYGLPWYFPTVSEVIVDRAGDCQAQTVLMASILEAKGMSYTLRYSFDHVWVDYPGKTATTLEDPATSFASSEGEGWLTDLPEKFPLGTILKQRIAYHWTPMPAGQKILILLGVTAIIGYGERRFFGRMGRLISRLVWRGTPASERPTYS